MLLNMVLYMLLYYSQFAKVHAIFVMHHLEMAAISRWLNKLSFIHPETHWKHETPLPGYDCITWVTHKLMTVVVADN